MKLLKIVLRFVRDRVVQPVVLLFALLTSMALKRLGGNPAHGIFQRSGFHLLRKNFRVIWPGSFLWQRRPVILKRHFPEIDDMRAVFPASEPSAFWIQRV